MDIQIFLKSYQKFLNNNTNTERARQEKRYLYSDLKHYGVAVWQRRKFIRKYHKELKSLSKKEALNLAKTTWAKSYFEERALALSVLDIHKDRLDLTDMPLIEKMMRECRGWAFLDSLIIPFMPGIIAKDKKAINYLKKWIKDNDFWVRRSALLAQLLFFRKGEGNKQLFFKMAKSQFDEAWIDKIYKDKLQNQRAKFFIRKAIGWTLREMSVKDPHVVFQFLKENGSKISGLSFREGSRKLPPKMRGLLK